MTKDDIKVNHVYSAKKPVRVIAGFFSEYFNDRMVIYISAHKAYVKTIDHGYTPEFEEWCKNKPLHWMSSEIDQMKYETLTGLSAKNYEVINDYIVQYDASNLKMGKRYPKMSMTEFLKWVGEDVTDQTPKGTWRPWVDKKRKVSV